jgi:hypothetical protein
MLLHQIDDSLYNEKFFSSATKMAQLKEYLSLKNNS